MLKGRKRRLLASPQHAMFAIIDYIPRAVRENGQPNDPMIVEFTLAGAPMMILTAGPHHKLTPAASISVLTEDRNETDRLWAALLAKGGKAGRCGSIVDRFGVS